MVVEGNSVGPLNYEELKELIKEGKIAPDSLVWKKGMESWNKVNTIADLMTLFGGEDSDETPPPIPDK